MPIRLERRYRFSAAHLYRRPEWSDEENERRFGKCALEPGHGHHYRLWVKVSGRLDGETGFVADLGDLDAVVDREVIEPLDHRHLNHAIPEFGSGQKVPTSENLVEWIRARLEMALPRGVELVGLRLEEDEDLACEWWAE